MINDSIIKKLLESGKDDAVAFTVPDRAALIYRALREHIEISVATLKSPSVVAIAGQRVLALVQQRARVAGCY